MFKQSEIGAICNCGQGETVCKEHAYKRYHLPKGHYSDGYYFEGGYFMVGWWSLRCEVCGNERDDIFVYKWHGNDDWTMIDGPMHNDKYPRRYPEVYQWIRAAMEA